MRSCRLISKRATSPGRREGFFAYQAAYIDLQLGIRESSVAEIFSGWHLGAGW